MRPPETPLSSSSRFVLAYTAATIPEGLAARGLLESEGIPVEVKGEVEGPYRFGPVYLFVPEELEPQARLLLEDLSSPDEPESADGAQGELESDPADDQA
jgi:Putative prokaryotic signal transducing protein